MGSKLLKLPLLCLIGGIILQVQNFAIVFLGYGIAINQKLSPLLSYIPIVLNIIIFIIIGLIIGKTLDRETIFKSATLIAGYMVLFSVAQQMALYFNIENFIIEWILYLPISIFGIISSLISMNINHSPSMNLIYTILSLLQPYIFVLFGKNTKDTK